MTCPSQNRGKASKNADPAVIVIRTVPGRFKDNRHIPGRQPLPGIGIQPLDGCPVIRVGIGNGASTIQVGWTSEAAGAAGDGHQWVYQTQPNEYNCANRKCYPTGGLTEVIEKPPCTIRTCYTQ